uniref:Uncharacterized protein n=1 Tax=Kalanchoe fedtschenkoi TaxID=63787 RepID=A0A7N0UAF3_KALFE
MGDRTSDSASSSSSIALLQERFKQLQRAREVRKERELLKALAESAKGNHSVYHDLSGLSFSSEYPHSLLSAQNFAQNQRAENLQVNGAQKYANTLPYANAGMRATQMYGDDEGSDVDTSLHL